MVRWWGFFQAWLRPIILIIYITIVWISDFTVYLCHNGSDTAYLHVRTYLQCSLNLVDYKDSYNRPSGAIAYSIWQQILCFQFSKSGCTCCDFLGFSMSNTLHLWAVKNRSYNITDCLWTGLYLLQYIYLNHYFRDSVVSKKTQIVIMSLCDFLLMTVTNGKASTCPLFFRDMVIRMNDSVISHQHTLGYPIWEKMYSRELHKVTAYAWVLSDIFFSTMGYA